MKKIIAIALAALLALTLASCGGRKPANDGGSAAEADTTAALAETTAGEAAPSDETSASTACFLLPAAGITPIHPSTR